MNVGLLAAVVRATAVEVAAAEVSAAGRRREARSARTAETRRTLLTEESLLEEVSTTAAVEVVLTATEVEVPAAEDKERRRGGEGRSAFERVSVSFEIKREDEPEVTTAATDVLTTAADVVILAAAVVTSAAGEERKFDQNRSRKGTCFGRQSDSPAFPAEEGEGEVDFSIHFRFSWVEGTVY